jgi:prepilin-type N-terminal cleavage/methylation domain-containing protein
MTRFSIAGHFCSYPLPRPTRSGPSPKGFTFVEVMITVGIITVGLLGILGVLFTSHAGITQSGRDTAATVIAHSLAENLRNQPQLDLPLLNGMTSDDPNLCPGAPGSRLNVLCMEWIAQVNTLPEGRGTVTVAQTPNPATGIALYRITITLGWTEASSLARRTFTLIAGRSD